MKRLGLMSLALLVGGCASMAPPYERPSAPVASSFPEAAQAAAAGASTTQPAADIDWQQFFTDPRLKKLIELSLQNNRDLRVAVLNVERVRAQYQIQRSEQFPTLFLGATGLFQPNADGRGNNSYYTAGLNVTGYELDLFGRVRSLTDAALQQYFASEEGRKAAQISLVAAMANTYLTLLADDAQLDVARRTLDTREQGYRLLKLKFDNGALSEYDLTQAVTLVEGAKAAVALLARQRMQSENALTLLVGQPLPQDLPPPLALDRQGLLADLPAGLPSALLERRPDVRQAERLLRAANANIGAARAAFFPRITLTGSVGVASDDLGGLFDNRVWQFAPRIALPIFDAGANQANLEVSEANRDIAVEQYQRSIQVAFREVADALAGRATYGEQLRAQQAQTAAEQKRSDLAELRFRNGIASFLDVLDAQRALFQTQQATIIVQAAQQQNLVTLYKALGGGWKDGAI
ncbi:MAG: efflux transporter outer membrane subunit [Burkholderiaceae bacterium]|nr:efflux transporter outer membrane subunit [Burkholderiaceae bacterium]